MKEPTQEEADEALRILSAQCGNAKIRNETKETITQRLKNIVPQETYDALDRGNPPLKDHSQKAPPPSACHLDNPQGGAGEIQLLEARVKTLEQDGLEAMSSHDLRHGYTVQEVIGILQRQIKHLRQMNQTTPENHPPQGDTSTQQPQGGVITTLDVLLEIRQSRALLLSQITEQKKRAKVKVQKLNMAEASLLDAYEDHDSQLTLFDLPPVGDDVRAILDDPQI